MTEYSGSHQLGFEPRPQKEDFSCGPGAMTNFLIMIGREDLLVADLNKELKYTPEVGTLIENIVSFLDDNQIEYREQTKSTLEDLEAHLRDGDVCLIEYQAWGTEEEKDQLICGHYSIVFLMDDEYVWLVDSGFGLGDDEGVENGITKRRRADFYKRWFDADPEGRYDHWMLSAKRAI